MNIKPILFVFAAALLISCGSDDNDDVVLPQDFIGELEYVKTYGGTNEDEAIAVILASDGNYVILGSTQSVDGDITDKTGTDSDYWLLKLDTNGNKIWSKTYGGTNDDRATNITNTNDGGFILSGHSRSSDGDVGGNEGFHDYWVVKMNSSGDIQWEKNIGFSGSDQAYTAFQTAEGNYFVTGFLDVTASGGQGNDGRNPQHGVGEYWGVLLDSSGETIWRRYFGGTNNDRSYMAVQTSDGGFLMGGASESVDFDITDSKGSYDYWLVKVSAGGDKLWTKSFGGAEIDIAYAMTKTSDGNFIIVGDARSSGQDITNPRGNADAWVVKFDNDGNMIWQKSFGGSDFDTARGIKELSNGKYLVTGNTRSSNIDVTNNNGQNDAWMIIMSADGTLEFETTIGGSALDFGTQGVQTSDGKLLVVGNTESSDFDIPSNRGIKDILIFKYK